MKKVIIAIGLIISSCNFLNATVGIIRDAGTIKRGTLSNDRLDVTVTTQGQLNDGTKILIVSSVTANNITGTYFGDGSGLTNIPAAQFTGGLASSQTVAGQFLLNVQGVIVSTHIKTGTILNEDINAGSGSLHDSTATLRADLRATSLSTQTLISQILSTSSYAISRFNDIGVDTTTIRNGLNATALSTQSLVAQILSTRTATVTSFNAVGVDTATLRSDITSKFNAVGVDTSTLVSNIALINASTQNIVALINSTANAGASAAVLNRAISSGTFLISSNYGMPRPVNVLNITGADYFSEFKGGTLTVRIEADYNRIANLIADTIANGKTTSSGTANSFARYDIIMDTWPSPGTDCYFSDTRGFNLCMSSMGVYGLESNISSSLANQVHFTQSTNPFTGLIKDGVYSITPATIPASAFLTWESSAIWRYVGGTGGQFLKYYGSMYYPKLDANGVAFNTPFLEPMSNSLMVDGEYYGIQNQLGGVVGNYALSVGRTGSSPVNYAKIYGLSMRDGTERSGINAYGDSASWAVINASQVVINFKEYRNKCSGNSEKTSTWISASTGVVISGNLYKMGNHAFNLANGASDVLLDLNMEIGCNALDTNGVIDISNLTGASAAGTWNRITGKITILDGITSGEIISPNGSGTSRGLSIDGLEIVKKDTDLISNTLKGIVLGAGTSNTSIRNTKIKGLNTGLQDSGSGTTKENFTVNGVQQ